MDSDTQQIRKLVEELRVALRERLWLMLMVAAVVFLASATFVLVKPARYEATALIEIGGDPVGDAPSAANLPAAVTSQLVLGAARMIESTTTLKNAIDRGDLLEDAEFLDPGPGRLDYLLQRLGMADPAAARAERLAMVEDGVGARAAAFGIPEEEARRLLVLKRLADNISVTPAGQSNLVEIRYSAADRQVAAEVANLVADAFVERRRTQLQGRYERVQSIDQSELEQARTSILDLEKEIQRQRIDQARGGLTEDSVSEIIVSINAEIADVEREALREAERIAYLRSVSAGAEDHLVIAALDSGVESLEKQATTLNADRIALMPLLGRPSLDGPQIQQQRARYDRGVEALRQVVRDYAEARDGYVASRRIYLAKLREENDAQLRTLAGIKSASGEEAVLRAELDLGRTRYGAISGRVKDLGRSATLVAGQSEIAAAAIPPLDPAGQGKMIALITGGVAAGGAALAAGLGGMLLDRRLRSPAELSEQTGLALGVTVGRLSAGGRDGQAAERSLRVALDEWSSQAKGPIRLVTFWSASDDADFREMLSIAADFLQAERPTANIALCSIVQDPKATRVMVRSLAGGRNEGRVMLFHADVPGTEPAPPMQVDSIRQQLSKGDVVVLGFTGSEVLPAAIVASRASQVAVVAVPWAWARPADLRRMPELRILARHPSAHGLVYGAPHYAA